MGCSSTDLWAFIVHGYRDSPQDSKWIPGIAGQLSKHRGGCVIVMDYRNYSLNSAYYTMVDQFGEIAAVLLKKVNQVLGEGFTADKGFFFGFSFGAELVFDVGIKLEGKIARIDGNAGWIILFCIFLHFLIFLACEPPGPGFENANRNAKDAAKNVQCIHTSTTFGTMKRDCHQDWFIKQLRCYLVLS